MSILDGIEQQDFRNIVAAMMDAGWNVTDVLEFPGDVEVDGGMDNGGDTLNFEVGLEDDDEMVFWCDFTHSTPIGNVNNHIELVEAFTELLPLRDDDLQQWIVRRSIRHAGN